MSNDVKGKTKKSKGTKKTKGTKKKSIVSSNFNKLFGGFMGKDPVPPKRNYKLNYVQNVVLQAGAAGVLGAQQRFCLNGMYDPDTSGGGHQPYGYDQLAFLYKRYKVNGVMVKITANDPNEDGVVLACQLTNPSNSTAYINGFDPSIIEERQQAFVLRVNNTGSQKVTKTFYSSIQPLSGLTKIQFAADPDNFTADTSNNPGSVCNMLLALGSEAGSATATLRVTVDITYYCTWYQRVQLASSTI